MHKKELIKTIAKETGIPQRAVDDVLHVFFSTVKSETKSGGKVQLIGFGTFSMKERAERTGRNPATGENMTIPASKRLHFKPSKS